MDFPNTTLMILTATASDVVEKSVFQLVHSPVISKGSINRPNVFLQCEELCNDDDFTIFANENKSEWQFPGTSCRGKDQCRFYIRLSEIKVYSSCPKNLHFLWADVQLSKGKVNNY